MAIRQTLSSLLALCLASAILWGCGSSSGGDVPANTSGSIEMILAAQDEIRKTDPQAIVVWAGGRKRDASPMNNPAETELNDFIALNNELPTTPSWRMLYDNGVWSVEQMPGPPGGIFYQDLTVVQMSARRAWQLVENAGLARPFVTWELFLNNNPAYPNPVFAFQMRTDIYIYVDTVTEEIWSERNDHVSGF